MKTTVLIILIITSSYTLNAQNSFSAKLTIPQEALQGEFEQINLDIFKPEGTRNYTVFTQELPAGFFVKVIDIQGATHTFENNILTITWMRSPAGSKVSVKYQIASMVGVTGSFNLSGKLTYMAGSKQGVFNIKPTVFNVVKEKSIVAVNTVSINNVINTESSYPLYNTKLEGVSCKRTVVFNQKKNIYEVEILLKNNINGPYSITERIPKDFKFSETDSQEAGLTLKPGLVQFFWDDIQTNKTIKIKYKLSPKKNNIDLAKLSGKLSLLKNGQILNMQITNQE